MVSEEVLGVEGGGRVEEGGGGCCRLYCSCREGGCKVRNGVH